MQRLCTVYAKTLLLVRVNIICVWLISFSHWLGILALTWMTSVPFALSAEPWAWRRGSWTSSVSLTRFVWAIQHGVVVGDGPRVRCSRAALAVWIRKVNAASPRGDEVPSSPSADESMLDLLVTSVRCGWTSREVLIWFFLVFGDLLFQMISDDEVGE